jgi:hypothetical protein
MTINLRALATAAALLVTPVASAQAQQAVIAADGDGVTFVNLMTPTEGVTLDELARQLTIAMETDASRMLGFRTASVHVSRDESYVLNYAQWDDVASVDAAVAALQGGRLPELATAFAMSSPEFHPYDVHSVTLAGE